MPNFLPNRVHRLSAYPGPGLDLRLDPEGHVYVIEANPNPQIGDGEDFAESAKRVGLSYKALMQRILALGLAWRPDRLAA